MMKQTTQTEYPQAVFAVAHTDIGGMPFNNHGRTLRLMVSCNVHAHAIRVVFSNRCGTAALPVGAASLALCDEAGVLRPDTLVPLTVGGCLSFELPAGEDVESDTTTFGVEPGDFFALNLYYPTDTRVHSGNWVGRSALRSRPGNFSADLELPGPISGLLSRVARTVVVTDMTVTITSVAQVVALCDAPGRVVGCFGDSVTQQSNWTDPLAKLLYRRWPGQVSLCNLGISGNRLLKGSPPRLGGLNGPAGIERFEHDLLSLAGLSHAILALGANDVGLPGTEGIPPEELPTTATYARALRHMAEQLHSRRVVAIAATITPRTLGGHFDEAREALRREWNDWIRGADCFDAVLDFDAVLRRPGGKPGVRDKCFLPDGLHPSPYGGLLLAKSIDLDIFAAGTTSAGAPAGDAATATPAKKSGVRHG